MHWLVAVDELEVRFHNCAGRSECYLDRPVTVLHDPGTHCNMSRGPYTAVRVSSGFPWNVSQNHGLQQPQQYTQTTVHGSSCAMHSAYAAAGAGSIGAEHTPAETGRDQHGGVPPCENVAAYTGGIVVHTPNRFGR